MTEAILEARDEILTLVRHCLPNERRRSLASNRMVWNIVGPVRRVCHDVTRWRDASKALRWAATAMLEPATG